MEPQEMSLLRSVLGIVVVLSAIYGSIGSELSPLLERSFELPHKRSESSPVYFMKTHSAYAPNPITLPKGSVSQPPVISPPKFEAVSPTFRAIISSVPPSAPPDHASKEHKWPRMISPSIDGQAPNVPLGAAHDFSPFATSPIAQVRKEMPVGGIHAEAPDSNFPFSLPHAPASSPPRKFPLNPPNKQPSSTRIAPSATNSPHTISFDRPAMSPTIITPPIIDGTPVAAPPKEISSHLSPVNHSHLKGFSAVISPTPHEFKEPSNITHAPLASPPHPSGSSPVISPVPYEVKPSNVTHAPLASPSHPSGSSPEISPVPHEMKKPSNITHAPLPSHPHPLGSSPVMSPVPHDVKKPPIITHAPFASHPHHSGSPPVISPVPHEVKQPSNITNVPSASHPHPSKSSPVISPVPHEVKNGVNMSSNIAHAPLVSPSHPSGSSLKISPVPHEMKKPSNITHAPLPSHPRPSGSSPVMSPVPHDVKKPSNITHGPFASHPHPSGSSPVISPVPHEVKQPSNITNAPLASHPYPSGSSPVISPVPHKVKNGVKMPSNISHAPLASHPHPSISSPVISPVPHEVKKHSNITHAPLASHPHYPAGRTIQSPALAPTISVPHRSSRQRIGNPASAPSAPFPPSSYHPGPLISPAPALLPTVFPKNKRRHHAPPPYIRGPSLSPTQVPSHSPEVFPNKKRRHHAPPPYVRASSLSPIQAPIPSTDREVAHAPSPSSVNPSWHNKWPIHSPIPPPSRSFSRKPRAPVPQPVWALPPPPPNLACNSLTCLDPVTYPPPGSLCVCVLPIKVGLRLSIALYTFFPLVSELAQEIASGIFMKQSQVRIMGANADEEDPEKTIVLIDLVPLGRPFDRNTPLLIYKRFWHKQVLIKASYFGDYDVLYVLYPGLPPSPPMAPTNINVEGGAFGNGDNGRTIRPLGVDVRKRKEKLSGSLIAIIVLSSVIALVLIVGAAWLLLLKRRPRSLQPAPTSQTLLPPFAKSSVAVTGPAVLGSGPSSSASFSSSIAAYTGSAKTFSLAEMERATNRFDDSRIVGEGGFGRVYHGTLQDGTMVAVKVLKRDDQQGGREFLAEVEMLSRLHHRNLVKLTGICTEENVRCLVYELIPNGSVESHLHGVDKDSAPLDWNARMKIALGAARGLAYLHEDSSPRVIHRDFKSSNILLEHDFTPRVSDFGLARTALDERNEHISTRVMGTFGYVAPEYAMTGHLLVKSDVYSYGVVLLELLTGRKPVDMSQPPGQENLVTWARPLLTSMDGLETIIDPALGTNISFDNVAKVAAIASMCVQPEVSHRPFMGEVVQALKLVCNDSDDCRRSCSQDESSTKDSDIRISTGLGPGEERVLSESDIFCTSARFARDASGSFRRYSSSGPLRTGRSAKFWQRVRGFSSGSMSDNGVALRLGTSLEGGDRWP